MLGAASAAIAAEAQWSSQLRYGDRVATASRDEAGYRLDSNGAARTIPVGVARSTTASALFDALFALAQTELAEARVAQITDGAFNHGQPLPCECLETGEKWRYVWTRDLAYATDLALFRFDPRRARNGLEFKLSGVRTGPQESGSSDSRLYVVQDTGSGGGWPVSTDRIVWFLGARHLLGGPSGDAAFAEKVYKALDDTLAQDRQYVFDAGRGLYRGETSFLDWREQSYPAWTAKNVVFIAESYALSTNVLYYEALRLGERMAQDRRDAAAADDLRRQATALKAAIDHAFWREDRGLYMSYIGGAGAPRTIEAYDLLGTSLAIIAGVAPPAHARRALANYPAWDAGSPVIWPERADAPIYHNRAIWPFVSAYALEAARALDEPARIAHEIRSIVRGAALAGSNMENYELTTQAVHVADGERSGPVVDSKRQLWSVAAYLDMVVEGVFGLTDDDRVEPKIPRELVPMLFGDREEIHLDLPGRRIALIRPAHLADSDNLLIAAGTSGDAAGTRVQLRGVRVAQSPLALGRPLYAPATPARVQVERDGAHWRIRDASGGAVKLYVNGVGISTFQGETALPYRHAQQCVSVTARDSAGIESLPSEPVCVGDTVSTTGEWPRHWIAPANARYAARLGYRNAHGPINTGITAAVKTLVVDCAGMPKQTATLVLPHGDGEQFSTAAMFVARAGQACRISLDEGFNMSYLEHYARYTGGEGGAQGPLNAADYNDLQIAVLARSP
ncbi:MAG TPA: Six-hairpin glycosidase-like protein [Rudaea sp.]|nr:Six-hairpin glycosidase-like protein [Rudaea sp.]